MKDLLSTYLECLASYNNVITNTKQQSEEAMSMIHMIQKINRIKEDRDMLPYYHKLSNLLYEYENRNTFYTGKET